MIAWIILASLLGISGLIYVLRQPGLDTIATGIFGEIMAPISQTVTQGFVILAYLAPLLLAVVPVYFVMSSKTDLENRDRYLAFAAIFGFGLYGLAYVTGIDKLLIQDIRGSWFVGSTLDAVAVGLGHAVGYAVSVVEVLVLWGAGLLLTLLDIFLDGLVGLGKAAEKGGKRVRSAQRGVLERLLGRS